MKKLLLSLVAILSFAVAAAQEEHSIIIDQSSFRPIQSDALTGVAIDPIGKDSSRRPCARIKVKINRMTREEINAIDVKIHTNNELIKCKTAEYDTGLILEMTALPVTRFYFYHPEFGYSNEVNLKLDADKEYYIEASLNQTYSIVVNCNVTDADVYIDGVFKGRTSNNYSLTVSEVMVGAHTLRVDYGGIKHEQKIMVNKDSIQFRQIINTEASKPQFVVFVVQPADAILMIDNSVYPLQDGATSIMLENGTYNYTISAQDYHDLRGTFTVAGTKVEKELRLNPAYGWLSVIGGSLEGGAVYVDNKLVGTAPIKEFKLSSGEHQIRIIKELYKPYIETVTIRDNQTTNCTPSLAADFANVYITAPEGADIWINGNQKGSGSWSGKLAAGVYLFEARKAGYKSSSMSQTISASSATQNYTLPAPTPIVGSLIVQGTPVMADVTVDGKSVGRLPLSLDNLLIGSHNVAVSKDGYAAHTQSITIAEGKTATITIALEKNITSPLKGVTPIKVDTSLSADQLNSKGIEFYNKKDYNSAVQYYFASAEKGNMYAQSNLAYCYRKGLGVTQDHLEAFKYYRKAAEQDYTSSQTMIGYYYETGEGGVSKSIDNAVIWYRKAAEQGDKTAQHNLGLCYEYGKGVTKDISEARKWYQKSADQGDEDSKKRLNNLNANSGSASTTYSSGKSYKVGDYYNENGLRGVVFEVSADGKSGKIVNMSESDGGLLWTNIKSEQKRKIGTTDQYDGENNMNTVKLLPNWESSYPVFAYCANLGKGWYLPASEELKLLLLNDKVHDAVNHTLEANGGKKLSNKKDPRWYWSSTEGSYVSSDKITSAKLVRLNYDDIGEHGKDLSYSFTRTRAIHKFGNGTSSNNYSSSSSNYSSSSYSTSGKSYKVGDLYNENGKKGVVIWTDASGRYGKIVSLEKSSSEMAWASAYEDCNKRHGTADQHDGYKNMQKIQSIPGWREKFPPFAWCADLGEGWYLPTVNELWLIYKNRDIIRPKLHNVESNDYYYTSTEVDTDVKTAFAVNVFDNTVINYNGLKFSKYYVRAVATFGTPSFSHRATSGPYKVGDYYNENGKEGVVFRVNASGTSGMIVSLNDYLTMWANRDEYESETKRKIKAVDEDNGWNNFTIVKSISSWEKKYPAFAWCANLGSGWYLPATNELKSLLLDSAVYNAVNSTLKSIGAPELAKARETKHSEYWLSTESDAKPINGSYQACTISMGWEFVSDSFKYNQCLVRAVAKFGSNSSSSSNNYSSSSSNYSSSSYSTSGKSYRIGDYYNENGKEGVVFEVDATGKHGKIISVAYSGYDKAWALGAEQKRFIGATDAYDGEKNMAVVKRQSNWRNNYPVFAWCASLGDGWYLPAKEEWKVIYSLKSKLESKLKHKIDVFFWTSTENNEMYKGECCSWDISNSGSLSTYCKSRTNAAFAVAKF